jgi:hypothetical protein
MRGARSARAKANYSEFTLEKRDIGSASEREVSAMLRSRPTTHNAPFDVVLTRGGRAQGVEVKTLIDQRNDKITVRAAALARKLSWGRKNRATLHTVVVDKRAGKNSIYYRKGVGSFRVGAMGSVSSAAHLRRLMGFT